MATERTRQVARCLLVFPLAVTAVAAQAADSTSATGGITGFLFDRNTNAPVVDARIVLRSVPDSIIQQSTTTDSDGEYRVSQLRFGNYVFSISRLGYSRLELDVLVDRAEPLSMSVGLSPVPVALPPVSVRADAPRTIDRLTSEGPSIISRRNTITETDIEERDLVHRTAFAIIRRLRPGWLTTRGNIGTAGIRGNNQIMLYVDGVRRGLMDNADTIEGGSIARIFLFDAIEATQRWGTGHVAGAINIVLKPPPN